MLGFIPITKFLIVTTLTTKLVIQLIFKFHLLFM